MSVCNYEPFWIITWDFSMHYWFAKSSKYIFKQHLRLIPCIGCELCTHQCVCVRTINASFTEEQVFRNLRIRMFFMKCWTSNCWFNQKKSSLMSLNTDASEHSPQSFEFEHQAVDIIWNFLKFSQFIECQYISYLACHILQIMP